MKTQAPITKLDTLRTRHNAPLSELSRYKLLVDSVEDYAIFMMDPNGYIETWNKGAQKSKGYKAKEIIGRHFSIFYMEHDIKAKKPERELELAKRYGRVEDEDWRVKKDGSKFWANVIITALRDTNGELVGFAKVTRNLSARKRHEDELRQANVALRQQQRELEALNTSKDEFVSLASHQLRTPATVIKQLLGLLLEGYSGPVAPEHYEILHKAYASNERQLAIVSSLLRVAQLDAGKVVLKKVPTDVYGLLSNIIEEQRDNFNRRKQACTLAVDDTLKAKVMLDSVNLRMALENIIDNASKYTPAGGSITVRANRRGRLLRIAVQDTGVGIDPQDKDKLFERFSRIPNELPNGASGSGLGLYWAQKVIELHGGRIEVESAVGSGSTFNIHLQAEKVDA